MEDLLLKWNLKEPEHITSTHTSDIYKVKNSNQEYLILKCFNETGQKDEAGSDKLIKWYAGAGSVSLINAVPNAHLLEFASGEELASWVLNDKDYEAALIICDVIKKLHQKRDEQYPGSLIPLDIWFKELFEKAEQDNSEIIQRASQIAGELFENTQDKIPLHGDLHHHNLINSERGWLAIDPKGLIGDPCYDLANFYGNPEGMQSLWVKKDRIQMLTDIFSENLGYPKQRLLKFALIHNVISSIWSGCEAVDKKARLDVASAILSLL